MNTGLDKQTKQIGDFSYTVTQLDAIRGRRVALKLGKVLAPAATEVATAVDKAKANEAPEPPPEPKREGEEQEPAHAKSVFADFSYADFTRAVERALSGLSEDDLDFLCDVFASTTEVVIQENGKTRTPKLAPIFGLHFAGRYVEMTTWLLFCIEVNFGSFLGLLGRKSGS